MKQSYILICLMVVLILPHFVFSAAKAQTTAVNPLTDLNTAAQGGGFTAINNASNNSVSDIVGTVITTVLSLLGVIFLVLTVYGGYLWMTDAGNSEQVEKAKKIITAAVIGLIIVVAAYAITAFVFEYIIQGTGTLK